MTKMQVKQIVEAELRKQETRISKIMDRLRKRILNLELRLKK
jgi:hypothetical protein